MVSLFGLFNSYRKYGLRNSLALLRKSGELILPNGFKLEFNSETRKDVKMLYNFSVLYGVKFSKEAGYWNYDNGVLTTPQGIKFWIRGFNPVIFAETFLYDIHFCDFDLQDKAVIQAGAFIGDTPLYYAYRGATVYSFEPDVISFHITLENMRLNPQLSKRVVLKNYAIGKDEYLDFPAKGSGSSSAYETTPNKTRVKSVSVTTILEEFNISHPFLLDLDIKGKEFEVVHDPSLSKFQMVRIEYSTHIGHKKIDLRDEIIRALKEHGFNRLRIYKHNEGKYDLNEHGTIEAKKMTIF